MVAVSLLGAVVVSIVGCCRLSTAAQASECPSAAAAPIIGGSKVYLDSHGSKQSRAGVAANASSLKAVRQALVDLSRRLVDGDSGCVSRILASWAKQSAFLENNYSFPRKRNRIRVATALNIAAARLRVAGSQLDGPTVEWLRAVTTAVSTDFPRYRLSPDARPDNLQLHAAVAAATYLLISKDDALATYQGQAWSDGLRQISPAGYVQTELQRGERSLLYHEYYLAALTMHAKVRAALGAPLTAVDEGSLARLQRLVVQGVCAPDVFRRGAPVSLPKQVQPQPNAYRLVHALSERSLVERLDRCGQRLEQPNDPFYAGDLRELPQLLAQYSSTAN